MNGEGTLRRIGVRHRLFRDGHGRARPRSRTEEAEPDSSSPSARTEVSGTAIDRARSLAAVICAARDRWGCLTPIPSKSSRRSLLPHTLSERRIAEEAAAEKRLPPKIDVTPCLDPFGIALLRTTRSSRG